MLNPTCPLNGKPASDKYQVTYRGHAINMCSAGHAAEMQKMIDAADRAVSDLPLTARLMGYRVHAILFAIGGLAGGLLW